MNTRLVYLCAAALTLLSACEKPSAPTPDAQKQSEVSAPRDPQEAAAPESTSQLVAPDTKHDVNPQPQTTPPAAALEAETEGALTLARQSGCLACHSVEKKVVGPAWRDVAQRYAGDAEAKARLIAKVKSGGKGNWSDVTGGAAMPPYSPRVSDVHITQLVEFVLSLSESEEAPL